LVPVVIVAETVVKIVLAVPVMIVDIAVVMWNAWKNNWNNCTKRINALRNKSKRLKRVFTRHENRAAKTGPVKMVARV
jgi:hypothetical protein